MWIVLQPSPRFANIAATTNESHSCGQMSVTRLSINAPAVGHFIAPKRHPSALIHNQLLGYGPVIEVTGNQLYAPADSTVTTVSSSGDFIELRVNDQLPVRLLLGNGQQFQHHPALQKYCKPLQAVKQGQVLVELNQAILRRGVASQRYLAVLAPIDMQLERPGQGMVRPDQALPQRATD